MVDYVECPQCKEKNLSSRAFCFSCFAPFASARPKRPNISDEIDYKIFGDDMQLVEIELDPGESIKAEAGTLMYMEDGIEMQTSTDGGLLKGLSRVITGESFFITTFTHKGSDKKHVAFGAPYPGKIIPLDLSQHAGEIICQKNSYLCSTKGIDISIAFTQKIGAGLFGGEGFILQRLAGDGLAFIHAGGTIIKRKLERGETFRVDTGCMVAFEKWVTYAIKFVGGFKNALFGGEGLFYALLKGPGTVYLQSLPFSRLADRIMAAASYTSKGENKGIAGLGGKIIGNFLQGDS